MSLSGTYETSGAQTREKITALLKSAAEPMTAKQIQAAIGHASDIGVEACLAGLKRRGIVVSLAHKSATYQPKKWKIA